MNRKYTCGAVQNNKICCQSQWVNCTNKDSCMCENIKVVKLYQVMVVVVKTTSDGGPRAQ